MGTHNTGRRQTIRRDPIRLAVVAHIRHKYTDYDLLLVQCDDKQEARRAIQGAIQAILDEWEHLS